MGKDGEMEGWRLSLVLSDSLAVAYPAVCHDAEDGDEVVTGSKAARGEVAAVLDGFVTAGWGQILRHGGGLERVFGVCQLVTKWTRARRALWSWLMR